MKVMDYEGFRQMVLGANLKSMKSQEVQELSKRASRLYEHGKQKNKQKQIGFYFQYVLNK